MADGVVSGVDESDLRLFDLASLSGVLRVCDLELVLLDGKGPRAAVNSLVHDEALFCTAESGFHFRGRFMLPPDWCMLGFVHAADDQASWCHGLPLSAGTVLTILPEGISEFVMSAGSRMTLVLMPMQRVQKKFTELSLRSAPSPGQTLSLFNVNGGPLDTRLQQRYEGLYRRLSGKSDAGLDEDEAERLLHEHLQALLSGAGERPVCTRGRRTHYLIAQRAENFMRSNLRRYIYMNEICDAAGVSERALRYAFEDMFGTSPNRYLSMLRLCAACRSLSMADSSRRSVKSIALSCGLWDLSRFADNYRHMFGELPRDTLMRAPAQAGQFA